jgi:hypothetical protein
MPANCLPRGISAQAFQDAQYMVEVFWYSFVMDGILGCLCIESTSLSNATRNFHNMAVWFVEGADPACIIGDQPFQKLGSVLEWYGQNAYAPDIVTCIRRVFNGGIHHAWFGYSMSQYTDDDFHCGDMYVQSPERLLSGTYVHFLVRDLYDPGFWNKSRRLEYCGVVSISDTEPPVQTNYNRINVILRHANP